MKFKLALVLALLAPTLASAQQLKLEKGDHICIVGNTLAERMQHYGWLETLIHARFPEHELVFRNLGYSGDEIDGWKNPSHRMRSMDFGSHDQWLTGSAPVPQPNKLSTRDKEPGTVSEDRFKLTNTKITASKMRRAVSGIRGAKWLPSIIPGTEPISNDASMMKSTSPIYQCPSPEIRVKGTACAISDPTIFSTGRRG